MTHNATIWTPQHTAHGLSIWTYGLARCRYVTIRRDVDGQRVVSSRLRIIRKGQSALLYDAFRELVTPDMGRVLSDLDIPCTCRQCMYVAMPYVKKLNALLDQYTYR